jgi:oligopeptidase B
MKVIASIAAVLLTGLAPPVAKKVPHETPLHGHTLTDDYAWLKEKGTPAVEEYLRAENAYADEVMKPLAPLRETLYREMVARIQETDASVPYPRNGWLYFTRTEAGKEHRIYCRKRPGSSDETVLLDLNALRGSKPYISLGAFNVSHDGNLLAYTLDSEGSREYRLHVLDLRTKRELPDTAAKVSSVAWASDNKTLLYVTDNDANRAYRLYRHPLGSKPALVIEEKDEHFDLHVALSSDDRWFILTFGSAVTNEARALETAMPAGKWRTVLARKAGREGSVEHGGDTFYVLVNDTGRNYRLVASSDGDEAKWRELEPQRDDVMIDDLLVFKSAYVLFEHKNALPQVRVVALSTHVSTTLAFDEPVFNVWPETNLEYEATSFRYGYSSMVTPTSVYERSLGTGEATLLKRDPVLGGYDPSRFTEERVWVEASDGVKVPVSVAYLKTRPKDGKGALLLEVYGAYGESNDVGFLPSNVSLLERGVALAIAHVRGGGELGKKWHDAGRMMLKRNTFTDLVSVSQALLEQKYVAKERFVLTGASAGGLTIGATLNLRPDLYKAVIALVPFVDVMNTMLDESLPLTVGEFEEWGNPKVPEQGEYMLSYSPYDNVAKKAYPAMLVRSAYNDTQVMYWEPAKWVAKLRALKVDSNPLLLKVQMDPASHSGKSGRYEQLREEAIDESFALWQMGISK